MITLRLMKRVTKLHEIGKDRCSVSIVLHTGIAYNQMLREIAAELAMEFAFV